MTPVALAFAGRIGSGKTTIALSISDSNGFAFASFGDYVRKEARQRGLNPESREVLQALGNELIQQGWQNFCYAVLQEAGWTGATGLVVDGIRHLEGLETLRHLVAPLPVFLIYVLTDEQTRMARLLNRETTDEESLRVAELHDTERQVVEVLERVADLIVDGTEPIDATVKRIENWLQARSAAG